MSFQDNQPQSSIRHRFRVNAEQWAAFRGHFVEDHHTLHEKWAAPLGHVERLHAIQLALLTRARDLNRSISRPPEEHYLQVGQSVAVLRRLADLVDEIEQEIAEREALAAAARGVGAQRLRRVGWRQHLANLMGGGVHA